MVACRHEKTVKGAIMPSKKIIETKSAPLPIGPYSQAVRAGDYLFCSGQVALSPTDGSIVGLGDVKAQIKQVMENIKGVLHAAEADFQHVVKTTIFLKNMGDFPVVNEIYGQYFKSNPPARSTVEVARLPKDLLVEVEVTAYLR